MEEISIIKGDSSDIYEFSSKQIPNLDENWEASYVVTLTLGSETLIGDNLIKNETIYNEDSLLNEDVSLTDVIFEQAPKEIVNFDVPVIDNTTETYTVTGTVFDTGLNTLVPNKWVTVSIAGKFVPYTREQRVKADANGSFTVVFNIGKTIKTAANSFFILQTPPHKTELLEVGRYVLVVEVRQMNTDGSVRFRKEIVQSKLIVKPQGLL